MVNLFFVIKTVLHLSVTTFFECEMKISFISIDSESENMESRAETDRRFESWKHVCYIPLICKVAINDRDSIKIREIKDYHIFWVRNEDFL